MGRMTLGLRIAAFRRAAACAAVLLVMEMILGGARAEEQRFALGSPLVLTDADGKTVTSDDFSGKWLLIYFGYSHCADQCPTALSAIVEALDEIGPAADKIQPLFVTVDPERDRGPALREFVAAFDKRIVGLTGSQEQVAAAAKTLGIKYEKVLEGGDDYVIDHSTTLSAIGPDRREALTFAMAEPYAIAAKLIALLDRGGVALGNVNNLGAYR
jgi:cytochrome oxidase Cu insertion factor (SCO1/SenC/PrrC family)